MIAELDHRITSILGEYPFDDRNMFNKFVNDWNNFDSLYLKNDAEKAAIIDLTENCIQSILCDHFDSIVINDLPQKQSYALQNLEVQHFASVIQPPINKSVVQRQNLIYNRSCKEILKQNFIPQVSKYLIGLFL